MPYGNNALSVRIADRLAETIIHGRFQPGDKLPSEPELSSELNVSRTTHDAAAMNRVYQQGREEALQRLDELKRFLAGENETAPSPTTDEQS